MAKQHEAPEATIETATCGAKASKNLRLAPQLSDSSKTPSYSTCTPHPVVCASRDL